MINELNLYSIQLLKVHADHSYKEFHIKLKMLLFLLNNNKQYNLKEK